jgi:hypothetical protein
MLKLRLSKSIGPAVVLGGIGLSGSLMYIHATIAKYEHTAPCYKLSGMPGVLQAAHFIPKGDCIVDLQKGGCHDRRVCKISNPPSGGSKTGHCTSTSNHQNCVCIADREGREGKDEGAGRL